MMEKITFEEIISIQTQADNDRFSDWELPEEEKQLTHSHFSMAGEEPPKVFWKYYDSYRRRKITLSEYSLASCMPISLIQYYLKNAVEKQSQTVEKIKKI